MGNVIIVQQICASWTKVSRGGENAARRNAVPEVATLPVQHITKDKNNKNDKEGMVLIHHWLTYEEEDGFSKPREKLHINPTLRPFTVGCVTIGYSDEEVNAIFLYNKRCGGAPDRSWARKMLHMPVDTWGQIVYNGRFVAGWEGPWYYEKTVVNIGIFKSPAPDVFTKQEPISRFTAMGDLY